MPKTTLTIMMMMMMIMTDPFTTNLVVKGLVVKGSVVKGAHPIIMMTMMMMKMVCVLHNVYTAQCPLPSADLNFPPILPQRDSCGLRDGAQELKSLLLGELLQDDMRTLH